MHPQTYSVLTRSRWAPHPMLQQGDVQPSLAAAHLHRVCMYALLVRALSMSTVGRCVGGAQEGELHSPSCAGVSPLCTCSRLRTTCRFFFSFCHAAAHSSKLTLPSTAGPQMRAKQRLPVKIHKRIVSGCQSVPICILGTERTNDRQRRSGTNKPRRACARSNQAGTVTSNMLLCGTSPWGCVEKRFVLGDLRSRSCRSLCTGR